jgi:hypothetical protein
MQRERVRRKRGRPSEDKMNNAGHGKPRRTKHKPNARDRSQHTQRQIPPQNRKLPELRNPTRPKHQIQSPKTKLRDGASTIPELIPSSSERLLILAVKEPEAMLGRPAPSPYSRFIKSLTGPFLQRTFVNRKSADDLRLHFMRQSTGRGSRVEPHAGNQQSDKQRFPPPSFNKAPEGWLAQECHSSI